MLLWASLFPNENVRFVVWHERDCDVKLAPDVEGEVADATFPLLAQTPRTESLLPGLEPICADHFGSWSSVSVVVSEPPVAVSLAALRKYPVICLHVVPGHLSFGLTTFFVMYKSPISWGHWDL